VLVTAAIAIAGLAVPSAQAELLHPRQEWLRNSTAGLFLHWGMFTSPVHYDCADWERAVNDGGWKADYWVDEARKLGASYVVLTTFHSRLGYARPWPSAIPGSCATGRDYLGELINAGAAKGVKVLLYMTDDPQWHNERGVESLDSAAYSQYKGQQVDLTNRQGFGMYSYDLFFEVMRNYPDLAGFWIDNDNEYWEDHNLYEQIRALRPSWLLSNNNEDTAIMDTVSNEQKTGMTPSYDYPQASFTPLPRLTEADYKLPTTGDWWYDGRDHAVDYRLSIGRYITNAGSSMKSLMAETAMVNGRFPPSQEAFNNFMAGWLPPIRSSIVGTEGGGYMYGGMQPGFWNDGAHGVITVDKADSTVQYVHVVTRPTSQNMVRIRDNGYTVAEVTDVRTGEQLRFNQSGGYLTILGIENWDQYDTVFKVATLGQQAYYPQSSIRASASASRGEHRASNVVDGSFLDYWDSDATLPVSMTLDLGQRKDAAYLAVNQREWSPTYSRSTFGRPEDSARIKNYRVYVSNDGVIWGDAVRAGILPTRRGVQFIDIGQQRARYLKLEVLSTWAGPQAPRFFHELKIDEVKVGHRYPYNPKDPLPHEAEAPENQLRGTAAVTRCWACSGAAKVGGLGNGPGNAVTVTGVQVDKSGDYRLDIDYTTDRDRPLQVSLNGAEPIEVSATGHNPDVVASTSIAVPLRAGANAITLSSPAAVGPAVDRISVRPLPPASYVPLTTLNVQPARTYIPPGRQSVEITGLFRVDDVDPVDDVTMAPVAPAGWTLDGAPVTASRLSYGETLEGTWTLTTPSDNDHGAAADVPITVSFGMFGRSYSRQRSVHIEVLPADRVFMREAESFENTLSGDTGRTGCSRCSGGEKVRNIGNDPSNYITFDNVSVAETRDYQLVIDYQLNGTRSFYVSVNGGDPTVLTLSSSDPNAVWTTSVTVPLSAGTNTIKFYNDDASAPDLDRIGLG
jgi:hypothetical protein